MIQEHIPVLLKEMLLHLSPKNGAIYVDATFGAGGYSKAILESADCRVFAIDRDETVIKFYNDLNVRYPGRIKLFIDKFSNIKNILINFEKVVMDPTSSVISNFSSFIPVVEITEKKILHSNDRMVLTGLARTKSEEFISYVDGVVFDLGVSSMQLNNSERGFSFLKCGPLDMRMDFSSEIDALMFVNSLSEKRIANIIYNYSGERFSRRIAKAIVSSRKERPIKTTFELANIVRSVVPSRRSSSCSRIDPATRTFQAIRIWVNDELSELEKGIKAASQILNKNGRLIVITFHSLEDRIVKRFFKILCEQKYNDCRMFSLLNKKVIRAGLEEINMNRGARSAKLRAIQKLL